MANEKLRRMIIVEAARMMYERRETEYYRAKMKAGKRLCHGWVKPRDLPSNAEIRDEIQRMAWLFEGDARFDKLRNMRIQALRIMHLLKHCRPKIFGSTLTGVFLLGVLTLRAHSRGTVVGIVASMATLIAIRNLENNPIPGILTSAVGVLTCVAVGYSASFVIPGPKRSLTNLTVYTLETGAATHE